MHDLTSWMSADFSPDKRLVFIGGEIDSSASERAVKALLWLESEGDDPIHVYLNSEGGDWYEGFAIYDAIRGCKSAVTITATGYCMSMASIILQAGDERLLTPECTVMIHDATIQVAGKSEDAKRWADHHEAGRDRMYAIYHEVMRSKNKRLTLAKVRKTCATESIYTAKEAVRAGLADRVTRHATGGRTRTAKAR